MQRFLLRCAFGSNEPPGVAVEHIPAAPSGRYLLGNLRLAGDARLDGVPEAERQADRVHTLIRRLGLPAVAAAAATNRADVDEAAAAPDAGGAEASAAAGGGGDGDSDVVVDYGVHGAEAIAADSDGGGRMSKVIVCVRQTADVAAAVRDMYAIMTKSVAQNNEYDPDRVHMVFRRLTLPTTTVRGDMMREVERARVVVRGMTPEVLRSACHPKPPKRGTQSRGGGARVGVATGGGGVAPRISAAARAGGTSLPEAQTAVRAAVRVATAAAHSRPVGSPLVPPRPAVAVKRKPEAEIARDAKRVAAAGGGGDGGGGGGAPVLHSVPHSVGLAAPMSGPPAAQMYSAAAPFLPARAIRIESVMRKVVSPAAGNSDNFVLWCVYAPRACAGAH